MSCIATLYILPENQHASFLTSKERESRTEETKFLFFTRRKQVSGEEVWQFLHRVAEKEISLEFSGYLLIDYLFVYLKIRGTEYFHQLDEYYSALLPNDAEKLASFFVTHPIDILEIERYLKEDGRPLSEPHRNDTLLAYEKAHSSMLEWCSSIRVGSFGVMHLSF